ncbi:MAG: hypothetical protein XE12_1439 [Synergistales bacterium 54_9]|nr:MAG: hypothetical protein XE12_1439 [Synergistales bacterium 54_9]
MKSFHALLNFFKRIGVTQTDISRCEKRSAGHSRDIFSRKQSGAEIEVGFDCFALCIHAEGFFYVYENIKGTIRFAEGYVGHFFKQVNHGFTTFLKNSAHFDYIVFGLPQGA